MVLLFIITCLKQNNGQWKDVYSVHKHKFCQVGRNLYPVENFSSHEYTVLIASCLLPPITPFILLGINIKLGTTPISAVIYKCIIMVTFVSDFMISTEAVDR